MFVDLILPLSLPNTLTYGVPLELQPKIQLGIRVEVKLGKNKVFAGLVERIHEDEPEGYKVQPIIAVIDQVPILQTWQLKYWQWIHEYYMQPLGSIMQAALPAHLKLMNESYLVWEDIVDEIPEQFPEALKRLSLQLQEKKRLTFSEVKEIVPLELLATVIQDVLNFELASISDALEERYKEKKISVVSLNETHRNEAAIKSLFDQLKNAPKQSDILMVYLASQPAFKSMPVNELLEKSKASRAVLNQLIEKEILKLEHQKVDRWSFRDPTEPFEEVVFSKAQEKALNEIEKGFEHQKTVLLHGVTGSGKTLLYIHLIQEAIAQGKQVLFLLPEIALTTQIVSRLMQKFGEVMGVYHSQYSNNDRVELWNQVQSGVCKLIVGARSSVWLPFKNLGLVVIDEEHDGSFKQVEPAPRYQARDAAIYLGSMLKANILLGTATPSLESMHNALNQKYHLVELRERYQNVAMPQIEVVPARRTNPALSEFLTIPLLNEIENQLKNGKQVILFQNKRGYIPLILCAQCQHVVQCDQCDVSLTYHKQSDRLHCHYCGVKRSRPNSCKACGSAKLVSRNFGTERVEEDLQRIFPKHKIKRLDWDTARTRSNQKNIIEQFEKGGIDILVGTQMVVKGFDFPNVSLVGVLNADSLWSFPNFRIQERAFQLLTQVSGRAGRDKEQGKVMIQAHNMAHPLLKRVINYDYKGFYEEELKARQVFHYPPITKLIQLIIRDRKEDKCIKGAQWLVHFLNKTKKLTIQGPATGVVSRIRNQYIQEIMIKSGQGSSILAENKTLIEQAVAQTKSVRGFSNLQIIIDVDPN